LPFHSTWQSSTRRLQTPPYYSKHINNTSAKQHLKNYKKFKVASRTYLNLLMLVAPLPSSRAHLANV